MILHIPFFYIKIKDNKNVKFKKYKYFKKYQQANKSSVEIID